MGGEIGGVSYFRVAQMLMAILGLISSLTCSFSYTILVVVYVVIILYLLITIIYLCISRSFLRPTLQAIIEAVLGLMLLIYTIYVMSTGSLRDAWLIVAVTVGFVLSALLFITAYEKT